MTIDKLDSREKRKSITVTFTYDEIRDIANGLYYFVSGTKKTGDNVDYKQTYVNCKMLFDLVEHGNIQLETIQSQAELLKKAKKKCHY